MSESLDILGATIDKGFLMMLPYLLIFFLFLILISIPLAFLSKKLDQLEEERKQKIWDQRHRKSKSALDFLPFIRYNISTGTPQDGDPRIS